MEAPMKYMKKPVVIEAIQWTGSNLFAIYQRSQGACSYIEGKLYIETLEGRMRANKWDYIIKDINGEFYPCKPNIFNAMYTEV